MALPTKFEVPPLAAPVSVTPFFIGTDPADYPNSEYAGWRVLGQEEDLGIKLIHLLSPAQQQKAIMTKEVPQDIITAAESGKRLVDNWGKQFSFAFCCGLNTAPKGAQRLDS